MFVEFHYQGYLYCYNVDKIVRFFPKGSNTHIVLDSTTGYEGITVDEDYDTVKNLIDEAVLHCLYPALAVEDLD